MVFYQNPLEHCPPLSPTFIHFQFSSTFGTLFRDNFFWGAFGLPQIQAKLLKALMDLVDGCMEISAWSDMCTTLHAVLMICVSMCGNCVIESV